MNLIKFIRILAAVDIGVVFFCTLQMNMAWLASTQLAMIPTFLIIFGSYIKYKKLVQNSIPDVPEVKEDEEDVMPGENLKFVDTTAKKRVSMGESFALAFKSGMNFLKMLGYVLLVGGFLMLQKYEMFDLIAYFFGLSIVPALVLLFLKLESKKA